MNCDDFRELISERVAGELSGEQAKQFDAHQQVCSTCRSAVRDWQQLENLLRTTWPSEDPPVPFFLPASRVSVSWLGTVRNWVSVASMAMVAASVLLLAVSRPSIQYGQHTLSINFGHTSSRAGAAPAEAVNQAEVRAWVEVAVREFTAQESARVQSASHPSTDVSREEESRRLARLGVELEMVKETQASLWQQVQQHGLYLESAWRRPSEQIGPNQDPGASRQ
jgi:anti-sigma factor RsiW